MSHALGPIVSVYQPGRRSRLILAALAAVVALFGGVLALSKLVLSSRADFGAVLLGLVLFFGGVGALFWLFGRRIPQLEKFIVHRDGLERKMRFDTESLRWEDVKRVRASVSHLRRRVQTVPVPNMPWILEGAEGPSIRLALDANLHEEVIQHLLPVFWSRVQSEIEDGRAVAAGPVLISREDVRHEGDVATWPSISKIVLTHEELFVVSGEDRYHWPAVSPDAYHHMLVLRAAVERYASIPFYY